MGDLLITYPNMPELSPKQPDLITNVVAAMMEKLRVDREFLWVELLEFCSSAVVALLVAELGLQHRAYLSCPWVLQPSFLTSTTMYYVFDAFFGIFIFYNILE
ncbi:hypothetical protein Fot_28429 [Forsythia ovata]|uniref:Uncharacterized protein n=1 Tax=Forsythia ovata TaxID=205694 RepID=A0ABD1TPI5_9LAMI